MRRHRRCVYLFIVGPRGHRYCVVACDVGRAWAAAGQLAADFNASQSEYRIVPSYKGNYAETVTAAIFAFRSRSQPAIVQVYEIATATMMAAKGAIYPVFELMRDEQEAFSPAAYLPAVTGYYADVGANMLSFPFNASTPKSTQAALDSAVERGNRLLRQFERANPDR